MSKAFPALRSDYTSPYLFAQTIYSLVCHVVSEHVEWSEYILKKNFGYLRGKFCELEHRDLVVNSTVTYEGSLTGL